MLVSEAVDNLANTELKQLKVGEESSIVMGYINEAVLELHKRFNIWQEEAIITHPDDSTLSYTLEEADANVAIDLSDHIVLIIDKIYDPDGQEMTINDEDDEAGTSTPKYNKIEFMVAEALSEYRVIYRASPIALTDVWDTIDIPPALHEAMYFYVGFRGHVSQRGAKEAENSTHFQRYINACNRVQQHGLTAPDSLHPHKFSQSYPWP
ncbi:MAG: hypothetical protein GY820_10455 [Gammaproteobacteria bacterium]|nr:hypothetical protein [Gammaproteobacteria bacterium]